MTIELLTQDQIDALPEDERGNFARFEHPDHDDDNPRYLPATFAMFYAEQTQGLRAALDKERDSRRLFEARAKELEATSEAIEALQADREAFEADKRSHAVNFAISTAIAQHKGLPHMLSDAIAKQVTVAGDGSVVVADDSGQPKLDEKGDTMTVQALVASMADDPAWGGAFLSPQKYGAGSQGEPRSSGYRDRDAHNRSELTRLQAKPVDQRTARDRMRIMQLEGRAPTAAQLGAQR